MSDTTYSNLPPLSAEEVLANLHAVVKAVNSAGPVPVEIATNPTERIDLLGLLPERARWDALEEWMETGSRLRVTTAPDVPPGEWWVKKSDGSHEVHSGGLVKREPPAGHLIRGMKP